MSENEDLGHQRSGLIDEIEYLAVEYARLSRRSVSIAWELGGKLIEAEEAMSRSEWVRLVNGLPHGARGVRATRFVKLRQVHTYESEIQYYESVTQALMGVGRVRRRRRDHEDGA